MADPYASTRAALAAWAVSAGAGSSAGAASGAPGGGAVYLPSEPGVGVYVAQLAALVATYPATGYARWLDYIVTRCTYVGVVEVYVGAIDDLGLLTTYGDGSRSEYDPNNPRYIPQGAAVYVVWHVPDATHSASAKIGFREAK